MTIDEVRTHLSAYLDGELGEPERREAEAALAEHPELRRELDELRRVAELVRSARRLPAPAGLRRRVEEAISHAEPAAAGPLRSWRPYVLAVAACLLVAAVAFLISRPPRTRESARKVATTASEARDQLERKNLEAAPKAAEPTVSREPAFGYREKAAKALDGALADKDMALRSREAGGGRGAGAAPPATPPTAAPVAEPKPAAPARVAPALAEAREEKRPEPAPAPTAPRPEAPKLRAPAAKPAAGPRALAKKEAGLEAAEEGGALAMNAARRAAQRDELADAIELARKAPRELGQHLTGAAIAPAERPAGEKVIEAQLAYDDLPRCLADVRSALDAANVDYAIQPIGGGRFVVETAVPAPEAAALLARLGGEARDLERQGAAGAAVRQVDRKADELGKAKGGAASTVRLVLRFARVAGQGAPAGAPRK